MLHCLKSSQSPTIVNHHSRQLPFHADITSRSEPQAPTTPSLTNEYTSALQTSSYSEIRFFLDIETEQPGEIRQEELLPQVLCPNKQFVDEILQDSKPGLVTDLLWSFFDHSENKAQLCLELTQSIRRFKTLISPLDDLLNILPLDSETDFISSPQCNLTFDLLQQYEQLEFLIPIPGSHNLRGTRHCLSDLNSQLETLIKRSNSHICWLTIGSAVCIIAITNHCCYICYNYCDSCHCRTCCSHFPPCNCSGEDREVQVILVQLDAAERGAFVLHKDIITIERLVHRLYFNIEGNKHFTRNGLWSWKDMHSIMEVSRPLKRDSMCLHKQLMKVSRQLKRDNMCFHKQLTDLEEHLCLSFVVINRAPYSTN